MEKAKERIYAKLKAQPKRFTCSKCPKGFQTQSGLDKCLLQHKKNEEYRRKNKNTFTELLARPFSCLRCGEAFTNQAGLKLHEEVCSLTEKSRIKLGKHELSHKEAGVANGISFSGKVENITVKAEPMEELTDVPDIKQKLFHAEATHHDSCGTDYSIHAKVEDITIKMEPLEEPSNIKMEPAR